MTSTKQEPLLLKSDAQGRVRTPPARQEALLDEFEKSGLSGARFAALAGIKYPTFAAWVLRRRRRRPSKQVGPPGPDSTATVRWLEAVVQQAGGLTDSSRAVLHIHLAGGGRLEVASLEQVALAAALLQALAKSSAPC